MIELILIRGLPGSGKSTKAKELALKMGAVHIETDMFWSPLHGSDSPKLSKAHAWCRRQTDNWLRRGKSVIVSNTFVQMWEMQPYLDLATKHEVPVTVLVANGKYQNIHGAPDEKIAEMKTRWEPFQQR